MFYGSAAIAYNSIISGNANTGTYRNCLFPGSLSGGTNIDCIGPNVGPMFITSSFIPSYNSAAYNGGSNNYWTLYAEPLGITTDYAGYKRISKGKTWGTIDIGAHELYDGHEELGYIETIMRRNTSPISLNLNAKEVTDDRQNEFVSFNYFFGKDISYNYLYGIDPTNQNDQGGGSMNWSLSGPNEIKTGPVNRGEVYFLTVQGKTKDTEGRTFWGAWSTIYKYYKLKVERILISVP